MCNPLLVRRAVFNFFYNDKVFLYINSVQNEFSCLYNLKPAQQKPINPNAVIPLYWLLQDEMDPVGLGK